MAAESGDWETKLENHPKLAQLSAARLGNQMCLHFLQMVEGKITKGHARSGQAGLCDCFMDERRMFSWLISKHVGKLAIENFQRIIFGNSMKYPSTTRTGQLRSLRVMIGTMSCDPSDGLCIIESCFVGVFNIFVDSLAILRIS